MKQKLVAAIACRNDGSRLFGKPLQNLDIDKGVRIIDHIIDTLKTIDCIDEIILGISNGVENKIFITLAKEKGLDYIIGDEVDVLSRLIECGNKTEATDIFRITSESPFLYFQQVDKLWNRHCKEQNDATFFDDIIDGCGFEIIKMDALKKSHKNGEDRHRTELCTLFIRENYKQFKINKISAASHLKRKDLRLTVDNPEDLVICRKIYEEFKSQAPRIRIEEVIEYLDMNPNLKALTFPFTIEGYQTMYL